MIEFNLIILFVLVAHIGLFIAIAILNLLLEKEHRKSIENVFFTRFPLEPLKLDSKLVQPLKILYYIYAGVSFGGLFTVVPLINDFGGAGVFTIAICIIYGLVSLLMVVNNAVDVYYVKQHVIISTIFMASSVFASLLATSYGILVFRLWSRTGEGSVLTLIFAILNGLISIASVILIVNPRLKDWPKLIKKSESEDEYIRPKFFPLAYTEWAFIALNFLSFIFFILTLVRM